MKDPKKVYDIVDWVSRAISKPVTVKIRKGFDADHVNAVEVAKAAEAAGAAAVAVHGRTRAQYYSGNADWDIIAQVKDALRIPVIGNGDITTPQKAAQMLEQTGCDGVMIGRGAQGNPWIFKQITSYLETGSFPENPSPLEVKRVIQRHAQLQLQVKGEYTAVREMRKHMSWYTTGYPNSAKLRVMINEVETYNELEALLYKVCEQNR